MQLTIKTFCAVLFTAMLTTASFVPKHAVPTVCGTTWTATSSDSESDNNGSFLVIRLCSMTSIGSVRKAASSM